MKFVVELEFEFDDSLTQEEINNRLLLIEEWSENQKGAFLEIPAGFKFIKLKRKIID
jgi:hypothetical protein